jgi:hypothetical protein
MRLRTKAILLATWDLRSSGRNQAYRVSNWPKYLPLAPSAATRWFGLVHQSVGHAYLVSGAVQASVENQPHAEILSRLLDAGHTLRAYFAGGNDLQRIVVGQLGELRDGLSENWRCTVKAWNGC